MGLIENAIQNAKKEIKTIVLPEPEDQRVLEATALVLKEKIADIVLIGEEDKINSHAKELKLDISKAKIIDPKKSDLLDDYVNELYKLRSHKGLSLDEARELMLNEPRFFACMMVRKDHAHGMVAGSNSPTSSVLKAALQVIKTAPGVKTLSSAFIMEVEDKNFGDNGLLLFADCAVVPEPTSEQLADIASSTALSARNVVGIEPRVALLSFSTKASAKHDLVSKVQEAVNILKSKNVDFLYDGEMQADAAIIESIGAKKAPNSPVAGKANILIFPDLQSGNIGYKLVQRFAHAKAHGPIMQGLAKPANDLSRGCSTQDIVNLVAITAIQK